MEARAKTRRRRPDGAVRAEREARARASGGATTRCRPSDGGPVLLAGSGRTRSHGRGRRADRSSAVSPRLTVVVEAALVRSGARGRRGARACRRRRRPAGRALASRLARAWRGSPLQARTNAGEASPRGPDDRCERTRPRRARSDASPTLAPAALPPRVRVAAATAQRTQGTPRAGSGALRPSRRPAPQVEPWLVHASRNSVRDR
jgi:hypothetical protein